MRSPRRREFHQPDPQKDIPPVRESGEFPRDLLKRLLDEERKEAEVDKSRLRILITPKRASLHPDINVISLKEDPRLVLLFLPDGNERLDQIQGGEGYAIGGEKVIETAEEARHKHPEIKEIIACILSPENIAKRSNSFFNKIYQAFVGLGSDIHRNQRLIKDGIRLRIHGDLNLLRKKSPAGAKLADIMETVCKMTDCIKNPALTLTLAIGYDSYTAQDLEVDGIVRTGMEEADSVRLSGLETNFTPALITRKTKNLLHQVPIPLFGYTDLWGKFAIKDRLPEIVRSVQKQTSWIENLSYDTNGIIQLVNRGIEISQHLLEITVPFDDNPTRLLGAFSGWSSLSPNTRIEFHEEPDQAAATMVWGARKKEAEIIWRILAEDNSLVRAYPKPYGQNPKRRRARIIANPIKSSSHKYDFILTQKQPEGNYATVPLETPPGYANILTGDTSNPAAVIAEVNRAINFNRTHVALKGGERAKPKAEESWNEFDRYKSLRILFPGSITANCFGEMEKSLFSTQPQGEEFLEKYNSMADIFVAKLLNWVETLGLGKNIFERVLEKRAFINYVFTSFFLAFYPNHPDWNTLGENWEKKATFLARYMGIVFLMDEHLFDAKTSNQHFRKFVAPLLTKSIQGEDIQNIIDEATVITEEQRTWLKIVSKGYREISNDLKTEAHPVFFKRWQESMQQLFEGSIREWNGELLQFKFVDTIVDQGAKRESLIEKDGVEFTTRSYEELKKEFYEKYLARRKVPKFLLEKINALFNTIENGTPEEKANAGWDFKQNLYLIMIEETIGAKLTYMTFNCVDTAKLELDESMVELFEETGSAINAFYRLANDLTEGDRGENDQDKKPWDTFKYLDEKYKKTGHSISEAKILATSQILEELDRLKVKIDEGQLQLLKTAKAANNNHFFGLATMIERTKMAIEFYKNGHYRTKTRDEVAAIIRKHRSLGIPLSSAA